MLQQFDLTQGALCENILAENIGDFLDCNLLFGIVVRLRRTARGISHMRLASPRLVMLLWAWIGVRRKHTRRYRTLPETY